MIGVLAGVPRFLSEKRTPGEWKMRRERLIVVVVLILLGLSSHLGFASFDIYIIDITRFMCKVAAGFLLASVFYKKEYIEQDDKADAQNTGTVSEKPRVNKNAILAFVIGVISLLSIDISGILYEWVDDDFLVLLCPLILGTTGLVIGLKARKQAQKTPNSKKSLITAGIICSVLALTYVYTALLEIMVNIFINPFQ